MKSNHKIEVALKGVVVHNGKVLLIQRPPDDNIGGGDWEGPGGKMEFGEDLETALLREIREEIGVHVVVERLLYATTFKTDPARQVVILTYLCRCKNRSVSLSEEHTDYRWASKAELKLLLPPEIIDDFEKNDLFSLAELE